MKYDGQIDLASGMGAKSRIWKNKKWQWSDLVKKLTTEYKTNETYKEFISASKTDQGKIKDVGGYVGGYLRAGRRKPENVVHRQVLTLDLDFANMEVWGDFTMLFGNAAVLHSTHKHSADTPRFRLVMPLDREVTPDEYVAISRQVAGTIGIDLFDNTTFETNRLMFWPSSSKDAEYFAESQDGEWLSADEILASYMDWEDTSLWPTSEAKIHELKDLANKQEDPHEKRGIIGAFCRTYGIAEAIEKFLSDEYVPTKDDRYTYLKGSTASGLVVYDDKFAYSHHGTDPSSGKLCNVFDLVRLHKFGHIENETKCLQAMEDFARKDEATRKTIADETLKSIQYDFADPVQETEEVETDWAKDLEVDKSGKYLQTAKNINLIFAKDDRLKDTFKENEFDCKRYVFRSLPWRKINKPEQLKNVDYSGVRNYFETVYNIAGTLKIDDSMAIVFEKNKFHPVKNYLNSIEWDGEERAEKLLIDYLGAEDNIYVRQAALKFLCAAVSRIFHPGCKFDLVLTVVGDQGIGKSTLFKKLGGDWFSDSFNTVKGKEAYEQIQGSWIIEMAELSGLRKAEVETIKHFISKQEDSFRPAYGRATETYKRQCVFAGTTNNKSFLRDPSGNRRFLPIDSNMENASKNIFDITTDEVAQIWAEAVVLFRAGEKLYLTPEAEIIARGEQIKHSEADERQGIIEEYLNKMLPGDWSEKDTYERQIFLNDKLSPNGSDRREVVCVAEVWCECLQKEKEDMNRYNTREVNDILRGLPDWEAAKSTKNFGLYGKQKYYRRK